MKYYITTQKQGKQVVNGVHWQVYEYNEKDLTEKPIGYSKKLDGDLCEPPEYEENS